MNIKIQIDKPLRIVIIKEIITLKEEDFLNVVLMDRTISINPHYSPHYFTIEFNELTISDLPSFKRF